MAEDQESKTEDPSGRRLEEARSKGNVALSRDVTMAAMLGTSIVVIIAVLPWSLAPLTALLRSFIEKPEQIPLSTQGDFVQLMSKLVMAMMIGMLLPMAMLALVAILSNVAQVGGIMWTPSKLAPNFSMLNPVSGFSRLFSTKALIEFGKGLVKLFLVGLSAYLVMQPEVDRIEHLIGIDPALLLPFLSDGVRHLFITCVLTISIIAAADYGYQKWSHFQQLKMSKQELKDEHKNTDGDPHIKGKQRAKRMARAKQRMLQSVPEASVIITNPTHYAVALKYDNGAMGAPRVVAKGVDFMARRIREIAQENDVPIVENPPVARALYAAVDLDQEIPPEHYKAVAQIIGYVMKLKRWKKPD